MKEKMRERKKERKEGRKEERKKERKGTYVCITQTLVGSHSGIVFGDFMVCTALVRFVSVGTWLIILFYSYIFRIRLMTLSMR